MKNTFEENLNIDDILSRLSGPVSINLTNDYLFRAILQRNNRVLVSLLSSLLYVAEEEIVSAEIQNPIELGKAIDDKEFILDIKVLLNHDQIVNLEMQVINELNWVERSTTYLCRAYDNLNRGDDYLNVKPALQIGLLNFTLFPGHPEFYAKYRLLNVKNYSEYTGKLGINVLDLTQIDLATDEDKENRIDYWARFFKARTWEEVKMLAEQYEDLKEAASTVYQVSREEDIRLRCEAREDYHRRQRDMEIHLERLKNLEEKEGELISRISEQQTQISEQQTQISEQQTQISEQQTQISKQQARIAELEAQLQNQ